MAEAVEQEDRVEQVAPAGWADMLRRREDMAPVRRLGSGLAPRLELPSLLSFSVSDYFPTNLLAERFDCASFLASSSPFFSLSRRSNSASINFMYS
jgi:hypothetical protein